MTKTTKIILIGLGVAAIAATAYYFLVYKKKTVAATTPAAAIKAPTAVSIIPAPVQG